MLIAIISALVQFLGSSTFASALHALLTDLGATSSESDLDAMTQAASELLSSGLAVEQTVATLVADYKVPAHQAAAIVAAATALGAKTS